MTTTLPHLGLIPEHGTGLIHAASRHLDPTTLTETDIADRFARATWTHITEPGDAIAGALIVTLGAPAALAAVIHRTEPTFLLKQIEAHAESPSPALDQLTESIRSWGTRLSVETVFVSLATIASLGGYLVTPADSQWPAGLSDLGVSAPAALWVRGNVDLLGQLASSAAVVGSRAASAYGEEATTEMVASLATRGVTIVSGAAYGIDGVAHRAALVHGGATVAVLPSGLDRPFPAGHLDLINRIAASGALVSEVPPGTAPTRYRFIARGRLMAALTSTTVVIEAGARSGALLTARHADNLGRPVAAVPGSIMSASSVGTNHLIHEGIATLVTSGSEILDLVGFGIEGKGARE